MTALTHYNAFKTHLQGEPTLASNGFDAARLDNDGQLVRATYWILYPTPADELDDHRFTYPQTADADATYTYDVRAVAVDATGALAVMDKIVTRAVGAQLTIAGRALQRVRLDEASKVEPDMSVNPPLFYCDASFVLISRRA